MTTGIIETAIFVSAQRAARFKKLLDSGVDYGEAMRQVYHPGMSKEDYAAWCAKYDVAYEAHFGVKLGSK